MLGCCDLSVYLAFLTFFLIVGDAFLLGEIEKMIAKDGEEANEKQQLGIPADRQRSRVEKGTGSFLGGETRRDDIPCANGANSQAAPGQTTKKGIDWIPVNDFTFYDHMLDMAVMFGPDSKRFAYAGGPVPLATYFAMARGNKDAVASEMTKWFNTNYHYIVPEFGERTPVLTENRPL